MRTNISPQVLKCSITSGVTQEKADHNYIFAHRPTVINTQVVGEMILPVSTRRSQLRTARLLTKPTRKTEEIGPLPDRKPG